MAAKSRRRVKYFRTSLRVRVALGVALPVLLVLSGLSGAHYWRAHQLLKDQMQLAVSQVGEAMIGSLRRTMLANDPEALAQSLSDMENMTTIQQVQIIGLDGQVKASSRSEEVATVWREDDEGCIECHRFPPGSRPRATWLAAAPGILRVSMPIANDAECATCHAQAGPQLGVLLADISVVDIEERLRHDLRAELVVSLGITLLVTFSVYMLVHWLVVRRVEVWRQPLARFATGDFAARLPASSAPVDELDELANTFNEMADNLQRRDRERDEREILRQQAIAEERGRIARELHDGLAQLLGYVNTKAMAVRLMLQNGEMEAADRNLLQLEEAARRLFVDVRKAIVELQPTETERVDLTARLEDQIVQFSRLSDMPVELGLDLAVKDLSLTVETEAHLIRIVQEALTNAYKHSSANRASVNLRLDDSVLELTVSDNGQGFDPSCMQVGDPLHFGLATMRERAAQIGAEFRLDSQPGAGTQVVIRLPLDQVPTESPGG